MSSAEDPNKPQKPRFAPKIPATRIKKEEVISLGTMTAVQEAQQKQREEAERARLEAKRLRDLNQKMNQQQAPVDCILSGANVVRETTATRRVQSGESRVLNNEAKSSDGVVGQEGPTLYATSMEKYFEKIKGPHAPVLPASEPKVTTSFQSLESLFKNKLILLKLPTRLPIEEMIPSSSKEEKETAKPHTSKCTAWPENATGRIGSIRRYASGRITFKMSEGVEFLLDTDTLIADDKLGFVQFDLERRKALMLGSVHRSLVAIPDLSKLLLDA